MQAYKAGYEILNTIQCTIKFALRRVMFLQGYRIYRQHKAIYILEIIKHLNI